MTGAPTPYIPPVIAIPLAVAKSIGEKSVKELAHELKVILRANLVRRDI